MAGDRSSTFFSCRIIFLEGQLSDGGVTYRGRFGVCLPPYIVATANVFISNRSINGFLRGQLIPNVRFKTLAPKDRNYHALIQLHYAHSILI